ncbi:30S ribosomal protein S2 [Botrimarina hoheduenensis]|uniref:Small ribosomal subunit protein uS2 n=1 Tax=Botrimarina hoheduenensis TaxID=2528000 RepID=A0A5C5WAK7_9BACT|nr:30S ribosomal protein S2 [Botrimarina hoheduenensis]TWT47343.1 30S ribosomal protein S2 [Botrimarina hoheduenensis]
MSLVNELVESGVHFGHRASRWNPKMRPYIYARRNLIHIIDVRETIRGLLRARKYLSDVAGRGSLILFVGTKRQASETVAREAARAGMPFVSERWLGGTLTNFRTIRDRLSRLEELEAIRQGEAIKSYSKKMQSTLNREYRKIYRNLNGMRTMSRLPECLFVIDPRKEKNAVKEARVLGIPVVSLIDTDCDPDTVDLPIPGNDDSLRSIELICRLIADSVVAGKAQAVLQQQAAKDEARAQAAEKAAERAAADKAAADKAAEQKAAEDKDADTAS